MPSGTNVIKGFQSFAVNEGLLQKVVEAIKKGDEVARSKGEIQSFEVFYHGFRQNIVIGQIMVVPASVCDDHDNFPLALLFGTLVKEIVPEDMQGLMAHRIGETKFDEYSSEDFKAIKDKLFKNSKGKYECMIIFVPSWANIRNYVSFKMTKDDEVLTNLVRHLVFSCYYDPALSSAFDTLTEDAAKVDVTDITTKMQYPFLTEGENKQYPELEKVASSKKRSYLTSLTAADAIDEALEPAELNLFDALDQALTEAVKGEQPIEEVATTKAAAWENETDGAHSPAYDAACARIDELEQKGELSPTEEQELYSLYGIVEEEDSLSMNKTASETFPEFDHYTRQGDRWACNYCPSLFDANNPKVVDDARVHTTTMHADEVASAEIAPDLGMNTLDPLAPISVSQDEMSMAGLPSLPGEAPLPGGDPMAGPPLGGEPASEAQPQIGPGVEDVDAALPAAPEPTTPGPEAAPATEPSAGESEGEMGSAIMASQKKKANDPWSITDCPPDKKNDTEVSKALKKLESPSVEMPRISNQKRMAHLAATYCGGCERMKAACICHSTVHQAGYIENAATKRAMSERQKKEAKLAKLRRDSNVKIADVPMTFDSIWNELTEDFGPAPVVEVKSPKPSKSESKSEGSEAPKSESKPAESSEPKKDEGKGGFKPFEKKDVKKAPEGDKPEPPSPKGGAPKPEPKKEAPKSDARPTPKPAEPKKEAPKPPEPPKKEEKKEAALEGREGFNLALLPEGHQWKEDKGSPDDMRVWTCPCGAMFGLQYDQGRNEHGVQTYSDTYYEEGQGHKQAAERRDDVPITEVALPEQAQPVSDVSGGIPEAHDFLPQVDPKVAAMTPDERRNRERMEHARKQRRFRINEGKRINFANNTQLMLWEGEIAGQISDGMWENSTPMYHWTAFSGVQFGVGVPGSNVRPARQYQFTRLLEYVGERMLFIAKASRAYPQIAPGNAIAAAFRGIADESPQDIMSKDYLKRYAMEILAATGEPNIETVLQRVNSVTYTKRDLKRDLRQISNIVNGKSGEIRENEPNEPMTDEEPIEFSQEEAAPTAIPALEPVADEAEAETATEPSRWNALSTNVCTSCGQRLKWSMMGWIHATNGSAMCNMRDPDSPMANPRDGHTSPAAWEKQPEAPPAEGRIPMNAALRPTDKQYLKLLAEGAKLTRESYTSGANGKFPSEAQSIRFILPNGTSKGVTVAVFYGLLENGLIEATGESEPGAKGNIEHFGLSERGKQVLANPKLASFGFGPISPGNIGCQEAIDPREIANEGYTPNLDNSPMLTPEIVGDQYEIPEGTIDAVLAAGPLALSYIPTSPNAGNSFGMDGHATIAEGAELVRPADASFGAGYMERAPYDGIGGIPAGKLKIKPVDFSQALTAAYTPKKYANKEEYKAQLKEFLLKVVAEVATTYLNLFKVNSRPAKELDGVPGIGELDLNLVDATALSATTEAPSLGNRLQFVLQKLNDSDIQDAINHAWAMSSVWHGDADGFCYEVYVRAESIDTDTLTLKYKFIMGTKGE